MNYSKVNPWFFKVETGKKLPMLIGSFDGLHKGHEKLIRTAGKKFNVVLITDQPNKTQMLISPKARQFHLKFFGAKNVEVYNVMTDLNLTSYGFNKMLKDSYNPSAIIVGDDFTYGCDNATVANLRKDFKVKVVARDSKYSTTTNKKLLAEGKMKELNNNLIVRYSIIGEVVVGKQLGRKLGFKTANIVRDDCFAPIKDGVYYGEAVIDFKSKKVYPCAIYARTLSNKKQIIETHILDKNLPEFYHSILTVYPMAYVGDLQNAKTNEELKQIVANNIKTINTKYKNIEIK